MLCCCRCYLCSCALGAAEVGEKSELVFAASCREQHGNPPGISSPPSRRCSVALSHTSEIPRWGAGAWAPQCGRRNPALGLEWRHGAFPGALQTPPASRTAQPQLSTTSKTLPPLPPSLPCASGAIAGCPGCSPSLTAAALPRLVLLTETHLDLNHFWSRVFLGLHEPSHV